jgi:WD40 repeat protein/serine/threonine protein kinase
VNTVAQSGAVNSRSDSGLAELVDEVIRRVQAGESIDPGALAGDDPDRAELLRQILPTLEKLADLGCSVTSDQIGGLSSSSDAGPTLGILGDFHLLREVGRGGMGIVYEAQQLSLHRRVALKVLPFAAVTDPKQLQRFQVEAQAAAQLHHTNIVPVFAVGCERGVHYYAMQFIEGQTLAQVIEELRKIDGQGSESRSAVQELAFALASGLASGSLTTTEPGPDAGPRTVSADAVPAPAPAPRPQSSSGSSTRSRAFFQNAARLGIQAAEALEHAHQQGVLHRDIKPSNLLLDARGNLWITDFGLARLQSEASLTLTGDIMGTLRYMSPEQAMAKRVIIDHRTDIYSLGATLYELMTLHPVFEGDDRQALLRQIAFAEPRPLRKLNTAVPRELETIMLKALSKDPSGRFTTAQELADDLRRFLEDRPIRAKRPTLSQRAAKWARRHTAVVYSALLLLALAVVGLSAGIVLLGREQARTAQTAENLRRRDYVQRVNLALREIQDDGNIALADSLLDDCPADLRGWEWDYVKRQAHLDRLTYRGHLRRPPGAANRPDGSRHAKDYRASPSIACVAVSVDGKWTASGTGPPYDLAHDTDRSEISLWDIETGLERRRIGGLIGAVQAVAISPDDKLLAAAGGYYEPERGGWLGLWDATSGKPLPLPTGTVSGMTGNGVGFSPDGKWLAVGYGSYMGGRSGRLMLIELATGQTWTPPHPPDFGITGLAFCDHEDRSLLAASGSRGIEVWDWKARTLAREFASQVTSLHDGISGHYGSVLSVAFDHDGRKIASGGFDRTVRLWELTADKVPRTLYGHKGYALGVAISPDGTLVSSVGEDRSVRLWAVATGRELAKFNGHTGHVFAVAFHPDGRRILSGGVDGVVKVWDLRRSRPVAYEKQPWWITGAAFSRDNRLVATESDQWRMHLEEGRTPEELSRLRSEIQVETKYWDAETGEEVQPSAIPGAELPFGAVNRLADFTVTSPDGRHVAKIDKESARNDVRVIDPATGRVACTLVGHTDLVTCVAFSPNGRRIATTSNDRTVKLWDAETGQEVLTLRDHTAGVLCVTFSPDGHRLVSGSIDRTARIWDATPLGSETHREGDEP